MVELRLLGPIQIHTDDGVNELGGSNPARLLVALWVADRHRLDNDAIVDRVWDDADLSKDPEPGVRTTVRRLRRAVGQEAILTVPGGYELDRSALDVDIARFDELIAAGRATTDPVAAITSFRMALDLWRGRPFGDFGDLEWLNAERARLEEAHLVALEGWHEAHLSNGTATEIIPSLEAATAAHPLRERFHRQLMHALYAAERQADALRAFQLYRRAMVEAGLEPGPETAALEQRIATSDPALRPKVQGRPLRGYRIIERLGEGAFSIVYRGTQPSVDREVAIKQIRSELADRPDFIRRFEAEAHMVARLEHPFIVPLFDYWREPGSAYLVMRLLPGGSLESSLLDGRWDLDRTTKMVQQIGAALSMAHRAGVVHRDVKPANILLDDEGNSFLTDFGIALAESERADPKVALSAGSPAYASPEQLRREPVGPSADVHGLAIAVYEALTGRLPFPDEPNQAALLQRQLNDPIPLVRASRSDLPSAVDDVLQRATSKRSGDRFQTVEEFVTAFVEASEPGSVRVIPGGSATLIAQEDRNPYKGLRAFDESDAGDFSGRDRLVAQLVSELGANRFVAVVGPSGAGKSSAVRAGLLPALRSGALPGSEHWFVTTLVPGAHPDEELEAALLRIAAQHPPDLLEVLRAGPRGLSRALRRVLPEHGELVLVIDQLEELFTLCGDEAERRRFLDGLAAAVTEERSRLRVIITLRADFYDRPLRYEAIGRLVRDGTMPVLPLAADELEQAIVEPAHRVGAEFEPGLVSEIIADVADQPGALPLLQYALTELYEARVSNLLTRDAYQRIGGVTGALATRAEELFAEADPEDQTLLRRLLTRLVALGEGREDTRRRVLVGEVTGLSITDEIVDRFGRARLLSFDRDPASREPTIEIAHEALLQEWPRLRNWLDDDRDGLRIHRHLTDTSRAWIAAGRDDGELYRGGRLESATAWSHDHAEDLNDAEREFLAASVARHDADIATAKEHAEQQARSNRRLRRLVAIVTAVAVIAAGAGVFAFQERSRANDKAAEAERVAFEAETARLVAQSAAFAESNPRLAALLAVAANRRVGSPETLGSLQSALVAAAPVVGYIGWGRSDYIDVEVLVNDRIVAVRADRLDLYDRTTGSLLDTFEIDIGPVPTLPGRLPQLMSRNRVDAADERPLVAAADRSGSVVALEVGDTFREVNRWPLDAAPLYVAVDSAGNRVAASDAAWDLHVWDPDDGKTVFVDSRGPRPSTLAEQLDPVFGPDWPFRDLALDVGPVIGVSFVGADLLVSDGAFVSLLDPTGAALAGPTLPLVEFAPGVDLFVSSEHAIRVGDSIEVVGVNTTFGLSATEPWPAQTRASYVPGLEDGGADAIIGVAGDGADTIIVSEAARIFALDDAAPIDLVDSQDLSAVAAARLGNEWTVATTSGIIAISELAASPLASAFARPVDAAAATVSQDGHLVAAGPTGVSGSFRVWASTTGEVVVPSPDVLGPYYAGMPPMLRKEFSVWGFDDQGGDIAHFFAIEQDELVHRRTTVNPIGGAGGDAKGELESVQTGGVEIVRSETGEILLTLPDPEAPSDATFHPTRDWLLAGSATAPPVLYDTTTWEPVAGVDLSAESIAIANWSLDGELLATAAFGESITIRDGQTFEPIHVIGLPSFDSQRWNDRSLIFSEDNSLLLSNVDGVGRLFDVSTGAPIGRPFPNEGGDSGVNWGTLPQLVTVNDRAVLHWNLDTSTWSDLACAFAGSELTPSEWEEWGPNDQPYEPLCTE